MEKCSNKQECLRAQRRSSRYKLQPRDPGLRTTLTKKEWLLTDWLLQQFSAQRARAIKGYIEFVGQGSAPIWENLRGQIYLGSERFVERMQKRNDKATVTEIPRMQRRPLAKPLDYYRKRHRDHKAAMAAAYASGDYSMQQIGTAFGVHYATVSRAIGAAEKPLGLRRS